MPGSISACSRQPTLIKLIDGLGASTAMAKQASDADWHHRRVQMSLADLATRSGCAVSLEPEHGQGRRADLLVEGGGLLVPFAIEVTRFGFDRTTIEQNRWHDAVLDRVLTIESRDLRIEWHLAEVVGEADLASWLANVREAVSRGDLGVVTDEVGNRAVVSERGDQPSFELRGIPVEGDEWLRLQKRIEQKAHQCSGGLPTWLHITHDGFLFLGNQWATAPSMDRLSALVGNAAPALAESPGISGLVLTTDVMVPFVPGEDRLGSSRRLGMAATGREVFIVPSPDAQPSESDWWSTLYFSIEPRRSASQSRGS